MSRWHVECLESPNVVYYLLLDMSGKPIARFVDEKTAEHIAKIHNEDLAGNYPEPKYPLRTRIHDLESRVEYLGKCIPAMSDGMMREHTERVRFEHRFLNHTHRISHDPAICALKNTSRPEAEEE